MTRQKTIEVTVCDACGGDCTYAAPCLQCKRNFCYDCRKVAATEYSHSVTCSGSGDGLFCHPCENLLFGMPSPIFSAYRKIKNLRREEVDFYASFRAKSDVAEAELKSLQKSGL